MTEHPRRPPAREAATLVVSLAIVTALAGGALRALDAVPQLLTGDGRGVTRFQSIEGAERALGVHLFLPAYFPDTLQWPPTSIRVYAGPPAASALAVAGRDGTPDRLLVYQAPGPLASVALTLMPPVQALHQTEVEMPAGSAVLFRVQFPDGRIGNDLVWYRSDETLALRYMGPADELVTIARSLRRRRP